MKRLSYMTEQQAQDVIDFIVKKSGICDIGVFVHVGAIDTPNGKRQLYELWAASGQYDNLHDNLQVALSYGCNKTVDVISASYPENFKKFAYRRALKKMLAISAKGYDIFFELTPILKKNTTLEQLLIEKDLWLRQ